MAMALSTGARHVGAQLSQSDYVLSRAPAILLGDRDHQVKKEARWPRLDGASARWKRTLFP
jgi:hypothetical protein